MKSKTFSVVVQKNINPYLHLQKIICWAKEDRLTKKWEAQKKKILARKRTERSNARQLNAIMHNDLNSCRAYFKKKREKVQVTYDLHATDFFIGKPLQN